MKTKVVYFPKGITQRAQGLIRRAQGTTEPYMVASEKGSVAEIENKLVVRVRGAHIVLEPNGRVVGHEMSSYISFITASRRFEKLINFMEKNFDNYDKVSKISVIDYFEKVANLFKNR